MRFIVFLVACLLAQWLIPQSLLLSDRSIFPNVVDARGLFSVIAVTLPLAFLATMAGIFRFLLGWVVILAHGVLAYANYENVQALGWLIDLSFVDVLTDPTFVRGSVMGTRYPFLLALIVLVPVVPLWAARNFVWSRNFKIALLLSVLVFAVALNLWPQNVEYRDWRQSNPVAANLQRVIVRLFKPGTFIEIDPEQRAELKEKIPDQFRPDLTGRKWIAKPERLDRPNIILVTLESVSAAFLEEGLGADDMQKYFPMPNLRAFASSGAQFTRVFSNQRQTHRGEYALLCGDFPNIALKDDKMIAYGTRTSPSSQPCLPDILRRMGYHTEYIRCCALSYKDADDFMPRAGFSISRGRDWFDYEHTSEKNHWGVDDVLFFEQVAEHLRTLHKGGKPFFLDLLTVGTHHPFPVDEGWKGKTGRGDYSDLLAFLDHGLGKFFQSVSELDLLSNTLIIVTADELRSLDFPDARVNLLAAHWLPMVVVGPGVPKGAANSNVFLQSDLAVSILDYLDLEARAFDRGVAGRSFFRGNRRQRLFVIGDTYSQEIIVFETATKSLSLCDVHLDNCGSYHWDLEATFPSPPRGPGTPPDVATIRKIIAANDVQEEFNLVTTIWDTIGLW